MTEPAPAALARGSHLLTRAIIWGGLVLLVLLVSFDFRAKFAATRTAAAWRAAQAEHIEADRELTYSQIAQYVHGHPARTRGHATRHRHVAREEESFTWHGLFRTYTVTLYLGLGQDPSIEAIEGPTPPPDSASTH